MADIGAQRNRFVCPHNGIRRNDNAQRPPLGFSGQQQVRPERLDDANAKAKPSVRRRQILRSHAKHHNTIRRTGRG